MVRAEDGEERAQPNKKAPAREPGLKAAGDAGGTLVASSLDHE